MTQREQRVWDAAFGAAYVRLLCDAHAFSGQWDDTQHFREDAECIADDAVEALRKLPRKPRGKGGGRKGR